jgi:lysophospholipid acyltransferase (LPLAT)-like uncharacterized protein
MSEPQPSQPEAAESRPRPVKQLSWQKRLARWAGLTLVPHLAEKWMRSFNYTALKDHERLLTLIGHEEVLAHFRERRGPIIMAFWHNRLMFGPTAYQYLKGQSAIVMVSRSFDGEIIAATIARFKNLGAARGSSSKDGRDKGGREALAQMVELCKQGHDLVITPDGPQGPVYQVKRGIIDLARATGRPIVCGAPACDRFLRLKSWDRTFLPLPYARFIYQVFPMIHVPPDADEDAIERYRAQLERTLVEGTEFVDHYFDDQPR